MPQDFHQSLRTKVKKLHADMLNISNTVQTLAKSIHQLQSTLDRLDSETLNIPVAHTTLHNETHR